MHFWTLILLWYLSLLLLFIFIKELNYVQVIVFFLKQSKSRGSSMTWSGGVQIHGAGIRSLSILISWCSVIGPFLLEHHIQLVRAGRARGGELSHVIIKPERLISGPGLQLPGDLVGDAGHPLLWTPCSSSSNCRLRHNMQFFFLKLHEAVAPQKLREQTLKKI